MLFIERRTSVLLFFAIARTFFFNTKCFKYYLDCSVTLSPIGLKFEHYLSCTMSHSVMAITEAVSRYLEPRLILTAVYKYTLSYLQTLGNYPSFSLFKILFKQQIRLYVGISEHRPVKDSCY